MADAIRRGRTFVRPVWTQHSRWAGATHAPQARTSLQVKGHRRFPGLSFSRVGEAPPSLSQQCLCPDKRQRPGPTQEKGGGENEHVCARACVCVCVYKCVWNGTCLWVIICSHVPVYALTFAWVWAYINVWQKWFPTESDVKVICNLQFEEEMMLDDGRGLRCQTSSNTIQCNPDGLYSRAGGRTGICSLDSWCPEWGVCVCVSVFV